MYKFPLSDHKKKTAQSVKNDRFSIFKKPPFLNLIYVSIIINFFAVAIIVFLKKFLPPEVPLFYGLAEGEDQLAKSLGLAIAPAVSLIIIAINTLLASTMENDLLKKVLVVIGFCVTIFSFITLTQIVLLVGYF